MLNVLACNLKTLKRKLLSKNVHHEYKIMPIRSNILNKNIFHYFKREIAIYVINFTKNPSIFKDFKIKLDKNIFWRLCVSILQ